ncbi:MAG: hypothetical protein MUE53_01555 [Chitinophagales bacterium]|jgi:hypothetical protein|nr:hypothetical protein [Chitinophagales bacterium]
MKNLLFLCAMIVCAMMHLSCQKIQLFGETKPQEECITEKKTYYKGKIVYRSCASTVVQFISATSTLGQSSWRPLNGETAYQNVFLVNNSCEEISKIAINKEFTFQINPKDQSEGCMVCAMYDAPPTVGYSIKIKE